MTADSLGNDITKVGVPVTGSLAWAPGATTPILPTAGKALDLTLPGAFTKCGLIKTDGGFDWTGESTGDALEFFQDGYSLPSGLVNATLGVTLAESGPATDEFLYGVEFDEHGHAMIDLGSNARTYVLFAAEVFKNGMIRRRQPRVATIQSIKEDKAERGTILGYAVVFKLARSGGGHYDQWWIDPNAEA